jgi:hypothetical protein
MTTRNELLGAVHKAAKLAGLDEDTYRDKLEQLTGKRSAKDCSDAELSLVLNNFHVKHTQTTHPHHTKIKALFIACYNLGIVETGTDAALDAFVSRQTGKLRLTFVTPAESAAVIEPLKDMLRREGVSDLDAGGIAVRASLCKAQWAKLFKLGAVRIESVWALDNWASRFFKVGTRSVDSFTARELDTLARRLGGWVRQRQAQRAVA